MEDALTEAPPPSRFFDEEVNNFTPPSPPLPSPFLVFSSPNPNFTPSLLIICISSPSIHLLHQIPSKTLIGTLMLPEIRFSSNPIEPSPTSKSCNIYSLNSNPSILFVSFQISLSPDRSHTVAKLLIDGNLIRPQKVLILDSIQSRNFRGKLAPDEGLGFKIETSEERLGNGGKLVNGLDWFPSGSVIDGLGAAIVSRCEMKKVRACLCVSWPECGGDAVLVVKSVLESVMPMVDFGLDSGVLGFDKIRDSELYT